MDCRRFKAAVVCRMEVHVFGFAMGHALLPPRDSNVVAACAL